MVKSNSSHPMQCLPASLALIKLSEKGFAVVSSPCKIVGEAGGQGQCQGEGCRVQQQERQAEGI